MNLGLIGNYLSKLFVGTGYSQSDIMRLIMSNKTEIDTSTVEGQVIAYQRCPVVNTAIGLSARAHSNLKVWAIDENGDVVKNATVTADLAKLRRFNPYQTFRTFNLQLKTFLLIFGKVYIYKLKIIGTDKYQYYIIPNQIVEPFYKLRGSDDLFQKEVDYYRISIGGEILRLETSEVEVIYDSCFDFTGAGLGSSRLECLKEPISTILSSLETSTQLNADGGARGLIVLGEKDSDKLRSPFLMKEKNAVQEALKGYGSLRNQLKYIVTKTAASFIPMTTKVSDMMIPEIYNIAENAVYKVFGIPQGIENEEPRFKVLPEATGLLYTNAIIPEGIDIIEALVKLVGIPERKWTYEPDWSHLDAFQESLAKSGAALQMAAQGITGLVNAGVISKQEGKSYLEPYLK